MKVFVAYDVSQKIFDQIEEMIAQTRLRDIEMQGVTVTVERDEYTWIDGTRYEDASLLQAVYRIIEGGEESPKEGYGGTAFGSLYRRMRQCAECRICP